MEPIILVSKQVLMTINRERIESLEAGFRGLHDSFPRLEVGVTDKLHHLKEAINKISDVLLSRYDSPTTYAGDHHGNQSSNARYRESRNEAQDTNEGGSPQFISRLAKLEFPRYSGDDPIEWITKVEQFFQYQSTLET